MPAPSRVDPAPAFRHGSDAAGQFGPGAYADWRATSLGSITEALEQSLVMCLAGPIDGRTVLDVGCGDGALASAFRQRGAASVIGCDVDAQMIARARTRSAQQNALIGYAIADVVHLPFRAESFDIVTMVTVLAFVPEPERALREITRVLKPGGQLVIGDLAKWSLWAASRRIRAWLGSQPWRFGRFRTPRELQVLMRGAGLGPGPVHGATYYPRWSAAARFMAPWDRQLGRLTTLGAAFLATSGRKTD